MERAGRLISGLLCWLIAMSISAFGIKGVILSGGSTVQTGSNHISSISERRFENIRQFSDSCICNLSAENQAERKMLVPGGTPFGIKLRTDGVMVVSVNKGSPADRAGIKPGDMISSVNGVPVQTNSGIAEAVQLSPSECTIVVSRGSSEKCIRLVPEAANGQYRIGTWVRDSAAGIGTLTYFDPATGLFGGLGHPVSDVTTGELMPISSGEITNAEIFSVMKGCDGEAGELCGDLCPGILGKLSANTPVGIFGTMNAEPTGSAIPMAFRDEAECGPAVILATIEGCEPQEYTIEIEKINMYAISGTKSMVIRVTDERLISEAGGIVRGMSGSPIIQNGMLVGAVTHVFLNDPTRGYAVFAQTMMEQMDEVSKAAAAGGYILWAVIQKFCNLIQ